LLTVPGCWRRLPGCWVGNHEISISSAIQKLSDPVAETAEIVVITHSAQEKAMQSALNELAALTVVKEISNFVRVEALG